MKNNIIIFKSNLKQNLLSLLKQSENTFQIPTQPIGTVRKLITYSLNLYVITTIHLPLYFNNLLFHELSYFSFSLKTLIVIKVL